MSDPIITLRAKQMLMAFAILFPFFQETNARSFESAFDHLKRIKAHCISADKNKGRVKEEPAKLALAPFIVTTTRDNGEDMSPTAGSLREAIIQVNTTGLYDAIHFDIKKTDHGYDPATNTWTIKPPLDLPHITKPVTIDGYTQHGSSVNKLAEGDNAVLTIVLNGRDYKTGDGNTTGNGLYFDTGSDGSVVRGLVINQWILAGIMVAPTTASLSGITIIGNFIGTDASGIKVLPCQNGVALSGNVQTVFSTVIGTTKHADRNIIAGAFAGLLTDNAYGFIASGGIASLGNEGTSVVNNYIGVDKTGTRALGNSLTGMFMFFESQTTVGGTEHAARNIISGNSIIGAHFGACSNLSVQGNYVGTDVTGTQAIGDQSTGIILWFLSQGNNLIGNLIAGNENSGLRIGDAYAPGSQFNTIQGNHIGTDVTGTKPIPNGWGLIVNDAQNTIGGSEPHQSNIVSANMHGGILVYGILAPDNLFSHNLIGTDISGTKALPNYGNGVQIGLNGGNGGTSNNTLN